MKRLVIVSLSKDAPGALALEKAAIRLGHDASIQIIGTDGAAESLNSSDAAIFRIGPKSYDLYAALQSQVNSAVAQQIDGVLAAFDKVATHKVLHEAQIASPSAEALMRSEVPKKFPVVAKILHGNQGNGVELINDVDAYKKFVNQYEDEESFLVQEFIPEANSEDKRLIIVRGELIAAMKRTGAKGDFRANLHTGGSATAYTPTKEEAELAIQATNAFGLWFAGVDIIDSARGPLVLEVNPSPGLAIGEVTDIDVATKIVEGVLNG